MNKININRLKSSEKIFGTPIETNTDRQKNFLELLNTEVRIFEKKFGSKEKSGFYSELGLLLSTGVDIRMAIEILEEDLSVPAHKKLLGKIKNDVVSGKSLSNALSFYSKSFGKYELKSIAIGEETGKLPEVLIELGFFYEASMKLRRQIIGVLTYPTVVISLALLIVWFMLSFVVPIFSDIFSQTGGQLPGITLLLIRASSKSNIFFETLLILLVFLFTLHFTQRKKPLYRSVTSALILRIPIVNKLIMKIYLARFCQSMKLLVGAKVMINDALELVRNMIDFYPLEEALAKVREDVIKDGKLLNESLSQYPIFPKKLVALIRLSEEVNSPEIIYERLHKQYTQEIEHQQAIIGKLIEPFFIIVLGIFIGFILVAMYLPMFEMSTNSF